jgi:hypothetical protein
MMDAQRLADAVFDIALEGDDAAIKARGSTLWVIGTTLLADILGRADELNRERMLRGLEGELRNALAEISAMMRGPGHSPYPKCPNRHDGH